ncbi:MAG: hypothetical protein JL50_07220 [Peptococcaceae bacterium BICA1-7]|nr:MAG: hypothetical protein JL50_07220 [Peptococcaceae bacterium BICA1-7]HBV99143.1 hypothetical protein [Desulfotomaculum sp.]
MSTYLKKALIMTAIILLPVVLAACAEKKADNNPGPGPQSAAEKPIGAYLPLQTGNRWEYAGSGNEYASYTQSVTRQKDGKYQVMVDNGGTITANRLEVQSDTIIRTYREGEVYDDRNILDEPSNTEAILLKLPITAGTSWISEGDTYKIAQTDARVDVPAGSFSGCVAVEAAYKEGNSRSLNYYKEGIGLVKSEFILESGEKIVSDLEKYNVGSKR